MVRSTQQSTIPVFIGWDSRESIAYHVLAHSIIERASLPTAITAVGNETLDRNTWGLKRGDKDSTEFSRARFAIPALANFRGWAIYLDCDMLCLSDIKRLWDQRDDQYAVMVVKH